MLNKVLLDKIALLLVLIGGLNWGLIGLFNLNAVSLIFGLMGAFLPRLIYIVVGVAAGYILYPKVYPLIAPFIKKQQ